MVPNPTLLKYDEKQFVIFTKSDSDQPSVLLHEIQEKEATWTIKGALCFVDLHDGEVRYLTKQSHWQAKMIDGYQKSKTKKKYKPDTYLLVLSDLKTTAAEEKEDVKKIYKLDLNLVDTTLTQTVEQKCKVIKISTHNRDNDDKEGRITILFNRFGAFTFDLKSR